MQIIMWQKRKIIYIVVIGILMFILLKKRNYKYEIQTVIPSVKAERVWEFVADFSNMKRHLIPHITDFSIISESGNYDHWKYSVSYNEPLPIWPYLNSFGIGHYSIKENGNKFLIASVHDICFFYGWGCSQSDCNFHISQLSSGDTLYQEDITYECPLLFSSYCHRIADYTRKMFIENLGNYFSKGHKSV